MLESSAWAILSGLTGLSPHTEMIMTDAELYHEAVRISGLSSRRFAVRIAWRDERTARRWMEGDVMPALVHERLTWFLALPERERTRLVSIVTR